MEIGLTRPLQRLCHGTVSYGEERNQAFCWDAHCITLHGRSSLLLVHCASRYTCVRFDMRPLEWANLSQIAMKTIRQGLMESGVSQEQAEEYCTKAGTPTFTRTHGRREVAFLNRAWEDVLASDLLLDSSQNWQSLLCDAVNRKPCRCAGYEGVGTARAFFKRSLSTSIEV